MSKMIGTIYPAPTGATLSPRLRAQEEWSRNWDMTERARADAQCAEAAKTAPPLSFSVTK
jgi:hypothetical protein